MLIIKIKSFLAVLAALSVAFIAGARAEDALKDGNRVPTLLYDQGGQPKRVSNTSPLPVTMNGQAGNSTIVIATETLPVPVKISSQTVPLTVNVTNQPSTMTVTIANQMSPVPISVNSQSLPLSVTVATQTPAVPVRISSQTIPLNVTVTNQPSTMTVIIGNQASPVSVSVSSQSLPIPVTVAQPIPVSTTTLSVGSERAGSGTFTLITPAPGKRIAVRGISITIQPATGVEADIRFAGGQLIHKVYRGDQSGAFIPVFREGAVNESVQGVTAGFSGGQMAFFIVNYEEK